MAYRLLLAVFFGLLEGLTEWLPISSTGHLILLDRFLGSPFDVSFFSLFEVVIQLGAILAVLVTFRGTLFPFGKEKSQPERAGVFRLWGLILLAFLPAAILGALLDGFLEKYLFNPQTVAVSLLFYGVLFLLPVRRAPAIEDLRDLSAGRALGIGFFQALALIPGTSRSGATLFGGTRLGLSRPAATSFSFFLAIPTMAGAGAYKSLAFFMKGGRLSGEEGLLLLVGSAVAFLSSLAVIRFLLSFVRRHSFLPFGIYRILLGVAVLIFLI